MKVKFKLYMSESCFRCIYLKCVDFGQYECGRSNMVFYGNPGVLTCNVFDGFTIKRLG